MSAAPRKLRPHSARTHSNQHGETATCWVEADAYLFDIDGTLLNSRDLVHYSALNHAILDAYDVKTTIDGIGYHGKTDLGILRAVLERAGITGDAFELALPRALEVVRKEVTRNSRLLRPEVCPGIHELLSQLNYSGKLLGLASGNLEAVGWHKIEAAGLREHFAFGCFSDHSEMREQVFEMAVAKARALLHPEASVCFLGDTPSDVRAARHSGAKVVAIATGIFQQDELRKYEPDVCIASCTELLRAVGE